MNLQKVFRAVAVLGFDREAYQATQLDHTMFALCIWWFNISITPSFSGSHIVLSKHLGVVFCFANIRGWWSMVTNGTKQVHLPKCRTAGYTQLSHLSIPNQCLHKPGKSCI
ncbi:hypothetical protein ARALYDRAFT_918167 [Arabidopsis lyrata subsp. lyrata]|uniref:Uncharacterized protein n=1 Tax=Arabidopsis lyrata subsp. lyrata TaxID=81972 RepID=D7MQZ6_ARALL|nr:hypothetical protein ARALYDRAFT_918167 [Arabidopsis lyrata subsp. lyrata]